MSQHPLEPFFHEIKCNGMTSFMELRCTCSYIFFLAAKALENEDVGFDVEEEEDDSNEEEDMQ